MFLFRPDHNLLVSSFILCRHLSQSSDYIAPHKSKGSFYAGPLDDVTSTTSSTTAYSDTDYSNDEGVHGAVTEHINQGQGQSISDDILNTPYSGKRRKGRKQKNNKNKNNKGQTAAQKKRRLRELKRKLLQEIDAKQGELSEKASALEEKIGGLESEIEYNKQTMVDFEERLQHIRNEMEEIDGIKANVSGLIKSGRKLASGKKLKSGELLPEDFLLPEAEFIDKDIAKALKEFLVKENVAEKLKRESYPSLDMSDFGFENVGPVRTKDLPVTNKRRDLGASLESMLMSEILHGEHGPEGL